MNLLLAVSLEDGRGLRPLLGESESLQEPEAHDRSFATHFVEMR
jgi:hypothetical protein